MNEIDKSDEAKERSWFERLSDALMKEPSDLEQLKEILKDARKRSLIDADTYEMLDGVFEVSDAQVRDIMVPRSQMVVVEHDSQPEEFIPMVIESAHSRFPVVVENKDKVLGILLAKDLLAVIYHGKSAEGKLEELLRPATFVPESKRLDALLKDFRQNHNHMAIVVDEYGGVSGLVTIEDVLEQIVGDIEDETDIEETEDQIRPMPDNTYIIKALTPIEEFNEYFNTDLSDEEFDTIGGIISHAFGHLPKPGENVIIDKFKFKILNANARKIRLLQMNIL